MFIKQDEKKYLFEAIKNLNDAIIALKQDNICLKNKLANIQDDADDRFEEHQSQINFYRKWFYDIEKKFEAFPPKKAKPKAVVQVIHKRGRGRPLGSKNK